MRQSQSTSKLRAPRWPVGLVPWRQTVERFLERLSAAVGVQIEIVGANRSQAGSNSLTFDLSRAAGAAGSASNFTAAADGTIQSGLFGGVMPTIDGTPLSGAYTPLSISGSGTVHVVCSVSGTLTTLAGSFVQTLDVDAVSFATGSDPGPTGLVSADGDFEILWATFLDGAKTYQIEPGDWFVDVIDRRDGTGNCNLVRITPP